MFWTSLKREVSIAAMSSFLNSFATLWWTSGGLVLVLDEVRRNLVRVSCGGDEVLDEDS